MTEVGEKLKSVLDGFANYLKEKELAPPRHRSHLVRWVREFLLVAKNQKGFSFEQTRDLFLEAIKEQNGVPPWQARHAADVVRIYRYQYRCANDVRRPGTATIDSPVKDKATLLTCL